MQQRAAGERLAYAGVGAGYENAASSSRASRAEIDHLAAVGDASRRRLPGVTVDHFVGCRKRRRRAVPARSARSRLRQRSRPARPARAAWQRSCGRRWPSSRARRASTLVYSSVMISISITGSANPACTSASPRSCMSTKVFTCWCAVDLRRRPRAIPCSVSGPNVEKRKRPPAREHARRFGEDGFRAAPLQRQVGEHERRASAARERQALGVGAHERGRRRPRARFNHGRAPSRDAAASGARGRRRRARAFGKRSASGPRKIPGAAAHVDDARGFDARSDRGA